MSFNSPPELKSLFETALNEFEKRAGTSLAQHQIINKLVSCDSADSVIDVLQEQAQAFRNFRGDNGKVMTWVKRTVNVLYALSTSEMLSGAISTVCGLITLSYWHSLMSFLSAFPSRECNLRWNSYTFWRMCPPWVYLTGF